jgi:hypothetical protein
MQRIAIPFMKKAYRNRNRSISNRFYTDYSRTAVFAHFKGFVSTDTEDKENVNWFSGWLQNKLSAQEMQ